MKKLIILLSVALLLVGMLASCTTLLPEGTGGTNHVHSFGGWDITQKPTCSEDGIKTRYCSCGETQEGTILAYGHHYVNGICEICGYSVPCSHENLEVLPAVSATCTESGLGDGVLCIDCGKVMKEQTLIDALGHKEVVEKGIAATCTTSGYTDRVYCEVCEVVLKEQEVIAALGHTEIVDESVAPTCTLPGLSEGKHCAVCKEVLVAQSAVEPLGHTEIVDEAIGATCTASGLTAGKHCGVCNEIITAQVVTDPLGHSEAVDEAVAATCTSTGLTEGKHCDRCNTVIAAQVETPLVAHTYTDKYDESCNVCGFIRDAECAHLDQITVPSVAPTCTEAGLTEGKKCNKCGEILVAQTATDPLGHTEAIDSAVEATCTATGLTEGKHCGVCGEIIVEQSVTDALGHVAVVDSAVAPDCINTGLTEGTHCDRCDTVLVEQETVNALGHTVVIVPEVEPTCTSTGLSEKRYCSACNVTLVSSIILPAEHKYIDGNCKYCGLTSYDLFIFSERADGTYSLDVKDGADLPDNIVLPEMYLGTAVTAIADYAFEYSDIVSIKIPPTINYIGDYAFYECNRLDDVYITDVDAWLDISLRSAPNENAVLHILDENGEEVRNLSIDNWHDGIREYAFANAIYLESVDIWNGVYSIGYCAFSNCSSLSYVNLPYWVEYIGQSAFEYCTNLYYFAIPECVTQIGVQAFCGCDNLYDIIFYDTIQYIGLEAFSNTGYYNDYNNWYDQCLYLGNYLIASNAWDMPSAYAIREGTTLIAGYAFAWCENLVEITIPDSVINICDGAFYECYNLTDVYYYLDEYEWNYVCIGWNNDSLLSANIHYGCNPNGTDGLIYEIVGNNEYATVVGYEGYESDVVIPLQYQGIPVTKIAEYAFYGQYLNSVSIPNSVTTIGQYAFDQCHIENLYIGTGVTIIEYYAFWNANIYSTYIYDIAKWCQIDFYSSFDSNPLSRSSYVYLNGELLVDLYIPDGVTFISDGAFEMCGFIQSINLPDSVGYIGEYAFDYTGYYSDSSNWEDGVLYIGKHLICGSDSVSGEYTVKDGTLTIADSAFAYNNNITGVIIPESVRYISAYAFYGCSSLINVVIPENIEYVSTTAFYSTPYYSSISNWVDGVLYVGNILMDVSSSLTGECVIREGTTAISDHAFSYSKITSVVIPDSVVTIGASAFYNCKNLVSVVIGENSNLKTIGDQAFVYCRSLSDIYIPASVESIGSAVFCGCLRLSSIRVDDDNAFYSSDSGVLYNKNKQTLICYPAGKTDTSFTVPYGVIFIEPYAFYYCYNLTYVNVYNSNVEIVGEYAFAYCDALENITFSFDVREIRDNALYACVNLSWVMIYSNLEFLGSEVFDGCFNLEMIEVYSWGAGGNFWDYGGVLYSYDGKTLIKYPQAKKDSHYNIYDGVTTIADDAFYYCRYLESVYIPSSVTKIGNAAFAGCENLSTVTFDEESELKVIGRGAFSGCDKLYIIVLPEGLTTVLDGAFSSERLISITIPSTVVRFSGFGSSSLIEIINYSELDFSPYTDDEGNYIEYAIFVHSGESMIVEQDGYLFVTIDGVNYLVGYIGTDKQLVLPDNFNGETYVIREKAFYDIDCITHLTVSNGVTAIEKDAFKHCDDLVSVTLGINLVSIGDGAFGSCHKLVEVINKSSLVITKGSTDNGAIAESALEVHTGESKIDSIGSYLFYTYEGENYLVAYIGDDRNLVLPSLYNGETYKIHDWAFFMDTMMTVKISDGVTEIGDRAFSYCYLLTNVSWGKNVTSIGYYSFGMSSRLCKIKIPASVIAIDVIAFGDSYDIVSVIFEDAEGWVVTDSKTGEVIELSAEELSDPVIAAEYISNIYKWSYWNKTN